MTRVQNSLMKTNFTEYEECYNWEYSIMDIHIKKQDLSGKEQ